MGKDIVCNCTHCSECQVSKAPPALLKLAISSKPWESVAVDILDLLREISTNVLVVQDYFSKWSFARVILDQTVEKYSRSLEMMYSNHVFTLVGPSLLLYSDQGKSFESRRLGDLCRVFGVKKSHTGRE